MKRSEDEKYEAIGKTVFRFSYFLFALKFVLIASAVSLVVLLLLQKPLWPAPLCGLAIFLLYRTVYRLILLFLIRLSKE